MWYRDFPLQPSQREKAQRADWTTHIAVTVRSTADLIGLFTHFESGGRTDAILRDNRKAVAALEWEWSALHRGPEVINEFGKLKDLCANPRYPDLQFVCLIGYAKTGRAGRRDHTALSSAALDNYAKDWPTDLPPLLLVVIDFEWKGKQQGRQFTTMTFETIHGGSRSRLRVQPAYPWNVTGSRWAPKT
jgi:hypothetical protein